MSSGTNPPAPVRIVVADDHPIFPEGLIKLLQTRPEPQVGGGAADGDDALRLVAELEPDLLLLDLAMPRMAGLAHGARERSARASSVTRQSTD
jgi:DNA-binding NarL/FixJ family response regulator